MSETGRNSCGAVSYALVAASMQRLHAVCAGSAGDQNGMDFESAVHIDAMPETHVFEGDGKRTAKSQILAGIAAGKGSG